MGPVSGVGMRRKRVEGEVLFLIFSDLQLFG